MSSADRTPGERLAQARREKSVREWRDLKRSEIAEAVGIDSSTMTLYEKGTSGIGEEILARLAAFLGVTPAYLRYGISEPQPIQPVRATSTLRAGGEAMGGASASEPARGSRQAGGRKGRG